mmetsp:Transcript_6722/g.9596  ORF Transcript_6722/g.9596 Transcript_6722/m.9596 type:complete len:377 (-) Transcript_6722:608-1738(-)
MITGAIVVVAKCPIPGKSKTRLTPLLGINGSALVAEAMLSDVLITIQHEIVTKAISNTKTPTEISATQEQQHHVNDGSNILKILLYAPGDQDGYHRMKEVLGSLDLKETTTTTEITDNGGGDICIDDAENNSLNNGWILLPMLSSNDLLSSDLGEKLMDALKRVRSIIELSNTKQYRKQAAMKQAQQTPSSILFLGMDSPELPLEEIQHGLQLSSSSSSSTNTALLCPSEDGGYGMLCVPSTAPDEIFHNIQWSHSLTALSQIKAITDLNMDVKLGRLMHDIDEPQDVIRLAHRLCARRNNNTKETLQRPITNNTTILLQSSSKTNEKGEIEQQQQQRTGSCKFTWENLIKLGLIKQNQDTGLWVCCDSTMNDSKE